MNLACVYLGVILFASQSFAAPGNVSSANCWAPFPLDIGGGVGYHNESVTYYSTLQEHDFWTSTVQNLPIQNVKRHVIISLSALFSVLGDHMYRLLISTKILSTPRLLRQY